MKKDDSIQATERMSFSDEEILNRYDEHRAKYESCKRELQKLKDQLKREEKEYKRWKKNVRARQDSDNEHLRAISALHERDRVRLVTEIWNAITHGIGAALGIVALVLLMLKSQSGIETTAYLVYAISIIILFLASTLYHSLSYTKADKVFRIIDHSSIFLLIAGTYTPIMLVGLRTAIGLIICGLVWMMALMGIAIKATMFKRSLKFSLPIYLVMGWLCIFQIGEIVDALTFNGILLLVLGGLSYTVGTYFYKNQHRNYYHVIWHIFVLLGAIFMFFSIYLYC